MLTVGEEGDILSDKSRVRETGRPIRLGSLRVRGKTFEEVLAQIPEGAFVSGRLEGDASVHLSGRKEVFPGPARLRPGRPEGRWNSRLHPGQRWPA